MLSIFLFGCGPNTDNENTPKEKLVIGGASGEELAETQVFRKNNGSDPGTLTLIEPKVFQPRKF